MLSMRSGTLAAGLVPFNITVTHYPEQDYALPVVVAQQTGYMAKQGIDVKAITGSSGGGTTVRNVAQAASRSAKSQRRLRSRRFSREKI